MTIETPVAPTTPAGADGPAPCVARPHANLVHHDGACRCFTGGPPPEHAPRPEDVLLVVSAFGMEPLSPGKRLLERLVGNAAISGTHERAPDGFVLAYGGPVQPGRLSRASVLDLAPTVLYFFGLPVGRDMEGLARTELFKPVFTAARPVSYIPSYGR